MNDPTNDRFLNAPQKGGGTLNAGEIARLIKNSSMQGNIVLDPFGGSGSTLIACEQLDRQCYSVELDPKFCDVIVRRYIEYAGTDAEVFLIRGKTLTPYADIKKED